VSFRSHSQLKQLRTCGESYRLARIERLPKRPSVAQVGGVVAHHVTETIDQAIEAARKGAYITDRDILLSLALDRAEEVWPVVTEEFSKNYEPPDWKVFGKQDLAWYQQQGVPLSAGAYIDWRFAKGWTLAEIPNFGPAVEVPFDLSLPSVRVVGWIDRVFVVEGYDGQFYPVDIKSGRKPTTDEQLGLYARALQAGLGWPVSYGFYVYNLKSGEAKTAGPIDLRHWTTENLDAVYGQGDKAIEAGLFIPNPGDGCFTCDVSQHCAFAQASI
jgi:putative RecB family exonuclease